ncbi:hypothetical protein DWB63_01435 [Pseudodesulfovibrio sp. S3]|nr:hypothetical protein [Pseudodesulfovibrio sp. S3-i]RWU07190.1 hypothetical protein DWB63_01435 [Pseudodesulfovibrio sp. S3]
MFDYLVRSNYLREVQRTFGGTGHLDVMGLITQALSVAIPVLVVGVLWHYRTLIWFNAARMIARFLTSRSQKIVENYLVSRGVVLEVCHYANGRVGRKICDARVTSVTGGRMKMQLLNACPTILKLKNAQVICFTKPFAYAGKRMNAFVTMVSHVRKKGIVLKELSMMTPIRYKFIIRRRHSRQRVAREGAVRVKAWSGRKANTFWMIRPDLQTVNNPARYGDKTRLEVENISAGGMRMFVINPKGTLPPLQQGNQLVLRVSIWNPKTRKYNFFTALGTIRSRFSGKGGSVGLGIQFNSEGEKIGSRYAWNTVHGEIKPLAEFLSQIEE